VGEEGMGIVTIWMCNRVAEPITLIRILPVVVLTAKKLNKVTILESRVKEVIEAESGNRRAPDIEGGKRVVRAYLV
jgi:ribosomal protein L3